MIRWRPARNWNGWDGRSRPDPVTQAALRSHERREKLQKEQEVNKS